MTATLRDSPSTRALLKVLPCTATARTWGEEVYFEVPVRVAPESDARQTVEAGDVCFWTEGGALALPYGRTPMSSGASPVLVAPCNMLGRLDGDPRMLERVRDGETIRVEAL